MPFIQRNDVFEATLGGSFQSTFPRFRFAKVLECLSAAASDPCSSNSDYLGIELCVAVEDNVATRSCFWE